MLEPRTHDEWTWVLLKWLAALYIVAYVLSALCMAGVGGCG